MPGMRVSLTARYVSHPTIDFGSRRRTGQRARLGLRRPTTVYHQPRARLHAIPTISALRPQTSQFHYSTVSRPGRVRDHRAALPLGLPRARRA
jgi:hypothetical protein